MSDPVNSPSHYTYGKVECIEVTENMDFLQGNAVKYLWRFRHKNGLEDLKKCLFYVKRLAKNEYGEDI